MNKFISTSLLIFSVIALSCNRKLKTVLITRIDTLYMPVYVHFNPIPTREADWIKDGTVIVDSSIKYLPILNTYADTSYILVETNGKPITKW